MTRHTIYLALLVLTLPRTASAEAPLSFDKPIRARDSLAVGEESSEDAKACLRSLVWTLSEFDVTVDAAQEKPYDFLVQFPSPVPSGDKTNDRVTMEWHVARDDASRPSRAPAVVVVHESGSSMTVGKLFADGLNRKGLHTFMIHLPYYGERKQKDAHPNERDMVTVIRQGVADVRRARDAVVALPLVDKTRVALQGTSLGGFVCATVAGLDRGYDRVFLLLAGGDLYDIIQHGEKDTAKARKRLAEAGFAGEKLKSLVQTIEPLRLAHRIDSETTWLYSGKYDRVVPLKNALLLAKAAHLNSTHHILLEANHYSGIIYLPFLMSHIAEKILH